MRFFGRIKFCFGLVLMGAAIRIHRWAHPYCGHCRTCTLTTRIAHAGHRTIISVLGRYAALGDARRRREQLSFDPCCDCEFCAEVWYEQSVCAVCETEAFREGWEPPCLLDLTGQD